MRHLLIHYHLFKNAGSSIDRCLQNSFADAWHAFDPDANSGLYTAEQLVEIVQENADKVAFSSHCLVPPLLNELLPDTIKAHAIIILREPISRVLSAYSFEWQKQKGVDKPVGTLSDYIEQKFTLPRRNAIENFQTMRLAVTDPSARYPDAEKSDAQLLAEACANIDRLPAFGLVEQFEQSIEWLQQAYKRYFPSLDLQPVTTNVTQVDNKPLWVRQQSIREQIGDELYDELLLRNQMDIQLYAYAQGRFNALSSTLTESAEQRQQIQELPLSA